MRSMPVVCHHPFRATSPKLPETIEESKKKKRKRGRWTRNMGCGELEHIPEVSFLPTADPRRVRERGKTELEIKPKVCYSHSSQCFWFLSDSLCTHYFCHYCDHGPGTNNLRKQRFMWARGAQSAISWPYALEQNTMVEGACSRAQMCISQQSGSRWRQEGVL